MRKELTITITTNNNVIFSCDEGTFVFNTILIKDKRPVGKRISESASSPEGFIDALEIAAQYYDDWAEEMQRCNVNEESESMEN